MKAIILAAGCGQRLHPYTQERPKCQLSVAGRPLLEWQLDALQNCGVSEICIVKGHASGFIPNSIKSYFNPEYATTNMVASLFCASAEMSGPCLVCYSDILYEPRVLRALLNANTGDIDVVVDVGWLDYYRRRYSDPYKEAESLVCGDDSRTILDIGRSSPSRDEIQGQFVGLIRLTAVGANIFLERFNKWRSDFWEQPWVRGRSVKKAFMTDFLQALIDDGVRVCAVPVHHGWLEFDSVQDYENVQAWHRERNLDALFSFDWSAVKDAIK